MVLSLSKVDTTTLIVAQIAVWGVNSLVCMSFSGCVYACMCICICTCVFNFYVYMYRQVAILIYADVYIFYI